MKISFFQKLRWEALRDYEQQQLTAAQQALLDEANEMAALSPHDFTGKLQLRSDVIDNQRLMMASLKRLAKRANLIAFMLIVAAFVLGLGAATQLINSDARVVNFYGVLIALLGLNTLGLLLWFITLFFKEQFSPILSLWKTIQQRLALKHDNSLLGQSAVSAWLGLMLKAVGRWYFHCIQHAYWVSFLLGALSSLLLSLSTQQYQFIWETTILPKEFFVQLTHWVAWLPAQFGLALPDAATVLASEGEPSVDDANRWAMLLVFVVLLYGVLPRLVLLIFSVVRFLRLTQAWQPDFNLPYYRVLQQRLQKNYKEVIDDDREKPLLDQLPQWQDQIFESSDKSCVLALEMAQLPEIWPPALSFNDSLLHDLGLVNNRPSLESVLHFLSANKYSDLLVICHLDTVPDRGVVRQLKKIVQASSSPVKLLLDHQVDKLALDQVEQRYNDWLRAAVSAGLQQGDVSSYDHR